MHRKNKRKTKAIILIKCESNEKNNKEHKKYSKGRERQITKAFSNTKPNSDVFVKFDYMGVVETNATDGLMPDLLNRLCDACG